MDYHKIHQNISKTVRDIMPRHLERLSWSSKQIFDFQTKQLNALLHYVNKHSIYYKNLLKHHDINSITPENLNQLPALTKQEVLEHWDDIVCVPDLTKSDAEAHLELLRDNSNTHAFLNNKYYVTATGGSSGLRGLYVWDLDYFSEITAVDFRYQARDDMQKNKLEPRIVAALTAPSAIHASTPLCTIKLHEDDQITHLPVDLPIQKLCDKLNKLQPTQIIGYASVIARLAREQLQGKLSISPKRATTNSEPLDGESRKNIQAAWGIKPNNTWGSVEMGIAGIEDDQHKGLILSEDMIIFEPVDKNLKLAQNPKEAVKLITTNLFNTTLPLIRYVVDDVVELCHTSFTGYQVTESIGGRTDDWFVYPNGIELHPMVFWHILGQDANVAEYQVEQTNNGVIVRMISYEKRDDIPLKNLLKTALTRAGLTQPDIIFEYVSKLPRHSETGKLRRFTPSVL
jgi:phenylacetate-CoA ligase